MPQYNGHKNRNAWNVSLWINNDEGIYRAASHLLTYMSKERAAKKLLEMLPSKTPDGVNYTYTNIRLALADF